MILCPKCGRAKHGGTQARLVGRFTLTPSFKADYPGAPLRETREQALADMCAWFVSKDGVLSWP